ncbi:helicase RepA family protein [Thalassovita taeanensis]|uniref:AAA domain-containing protein n=1 Tax=Thalassovita taeanensis TaxID=657014 RepID=A0A1H9JVG6_9RHOB|nr:helicase RepA family protein [Thalassovita taeanensis]SEQ90777.1 AAA domain-containing protein [Thalassovita taeanensis]
MTALPDHGYLSSFIAHYGVSAATSGAAEAGRAQSFSRPQTRSDEEVRAACRSASNGANFIALEAGKHKGVSADHADFDHSGADQAFTNYVYFHSGNYEQTKRIVLASKLGQREKMQNRPDYLERTLDRAADQEFALVDYPNLQDKVVVPNSQRFKLLSGSAIDALVPIGWRVKSVFVAEGLGSIVGPSKSGKSFLATCLGCAIAEGQGWFGFKTKPAPVVYVSLEGNAGFQQRAKAWTTYHGRPMPENFAAILQPFLLTSEQDIQDLAAVCPQGCVVIIDTLSRATPGLDENSGKDMGVIVAAASRLQLLIGGLVILVHHTGKDVEKGSRGHSSLPAALDGSLVVSRDGDCRAFTLDKVKDGEDGAKFGFRLQTVKIGIDEDGDEITSCVVIPDESGSISKADRLTPSQKFAFTTFMKAFSEIERPDFSGLRIGVPLATWRDVFYREDTADNAEAKRKRFQRARSDLVRIGKLTVEDDVYYSGPSFPSVADQLGGGENE